MANQIRGRFQKEAAKTALDYSSSIHYDWRLYPYDIAGSMAHAKMLAKQGIITMAEGKAIIEGLAEIGEEISEGKFEF
jgi:argininosuccinate lyase